jgi:hypothetical protein
MRASLPPRRHRDHHRNKHNSSSHPQPMGPQHPYNNADQHATSSTTSKLHTTSDGAPEHDAFKKVTTPRRRRRTSRRTRFSPCPPCSESAVPRHDAPSRETDAARAPPSWPPSTGKDLRPTAPRPPPAHGPARSQNRHLRNSTTWRAAVPPEAPPRRCTKLEATPSPTATVTPSSSTEAESRAPACTPNGRPRASTSPASTQTRAAGP